MKSTFVSIRAFASRIPSLFIVILAFAFGYLFKGAVTTPLEPRSEAANVAAEEVWTCAMHPEVRLPKPGTCPKCGMKLTLMESTPASKPLAAAEEKKYACAMFCVPPLSKPGKCPVCGMEMVEVDAGAGGPQDAVGAVSFTLSPAAQKLAEIEVAPVERKLVSAEIRMVGKIDYDETRLKYITAWVPGRLDRLYVDYTGVPVKEGDHLVYMYSPELLVAQVELLRAIETAGRLQDRADASVRRSAEGLVEDARRKLRLWGLSDAQVQEIETRGTPSDHMTIYAPIGGIVVEKTATEGMYVDTGSRIYTIADLSRLWVKLDAYESDLAWLRYGQTVTFETEAYPGEAFTGTVAFIDPVLNSKTRTVKVRVIVENADGRLKPEMFVRAVARATLAEGGLVVDRSLAGKWISPMHPEVVKDGPGSCDVCGMPLVRAETLGYVSKDEVEARPPLVVPASAPLRTGRRAVVYVESPGKPGTYAGREITLGPRAGDYYLVRAGLNEGERVVVNGNFKIDSAIQIQAKPSMMNPAGGGGTPGHAHAAGQHAGAHGAHEEEAPGMKSEASGVALKRFVVPTAIQPQLKAVFDAYFDVQTALSLDEPDKAQEAANGLAQAVDRVDMKLFEGPAHEAWMKERNAIEETATAVHKASDVVKARHAFALLSESMIGLARRFGAGGITVYRIHCPMAFNDRGADWLQKTSQTANPYFGAAMFRCGTIRETLEPAAAPPNTAEAEPTSQPDSPTRGPESSAVSPHPLQAVFDTYLKMQTALSLDRFSQAQAAAKELAREAGTIAMAALEGTLHATWMRENEKIRKAAGAIATAVDVEVARRSFAPLSMSLITIARESRANAKPLYRVHCPMAFNNTGADWLQETEKPANPYFGSAMLRCGAVKEKFGKALAE